ncbi:TPA: DUF1737 domain-containing protein, partial [Salmonella enterica]|nr:DUF1737 domain-containing protein [Salmonella enterica]
MNYTRYDLVTANTHTELQARLTEKIALGWQPYGAPVTASAPGTPFYLMQAIVTVTCGTPSVISPEKPDSSAHTSPPEYYFVIPVAGQSNMMAYGEGLPLPDTLDAPHPRIKQLARRATVTPGGAACQYNDIIPLDHCPHDVQDMSGYSHPKADLSKGEYGTVGQALHIAKKLLSYIPEEAGILIVPCSRGGAAFTQGVDGTFNT